MDLTKAETLIRAHADDTVTVPGLYAAERVALATVLAEYDRLRANENDRRQAGQAAMEAAARIDAAASHGVPCGSEDPVTANDWDRVLRYARCGGTEPAV